MYFRWVIGVIGAIVHGSHSLIVYIAPSVLLQPILKELDLRVAQATFPLNVGKVLMILTLPIFGVGIDRYGARIAVLLGVGIAIVAGLVYSQMKSVIQLTIVQIFFALSYSLAGTSTIMILVTSWFEDCVGTSVAMVLAGYSCANTLGPLAIGWLMKRFTWRKTSFIITASLACINLPLVAFLRPNDEASPPSSSSPPQGSIIVPNNEEEEEDIPWSEDHHPRYPSRPPSRETLSFRKNLTLLGILFFSLEYVMSVMYEHLILFLTTSPGLKFNYGEAIWYYSTMNLSAMFAKFTSGVLSDRTSTQRWLVGSSVLFSTSTLLLYGLPLSSSPTSTVSVFGIGETSSQWSMRCFVVAFGIGFGSVMNCEYALVPKILGRDGLGFSQSFLVALKILGSWTGSTVTSLQRDWSGLYLYSFFTITAVTLIIFFVSIILLVYQPVALEVFTPELKSSELYDYMESSEDSSS